VKSFHIITVILAIVLIPLLGCASQPAPAAPTTPATPAAQPATINTPTAPTPPKVIVKETELKYDDGIPNSCASMIENYGFLVDFISPANPFTIKKVRALGAIYTMDSDISSKNFDIEILDKDMKSISKNTFPLNKFAKQSYSGKFVSEQLAWVDLEMPDVKVNDIFYVFVNQINPSYGGLSGIYLGYDNYSTNEHSNAALRDGDNIKSNWPYPKNSDIYDKAKVNWMVRVVGSYSTTE